MLTGGLHNDLTTMLYCVDRSSMQINVNCFILLKLVFLIINEAAPLLILKWVFFVSLFGGELWVQEGRESISLLLHCYASACEANMAATCWCFRAEC